MYIGKHREPHVESETAVESISVSIPENYHGSAFSKEQLEEAPLVKSDEREEQESCNAKALPVSIQAPPRKESTQPFRLDKLFSSDALLILLAILLSGSEEGGELAVILLLLLLL